MDNMRSRSFRDGMMQLDVYGDRLAVAPPLVMHDFRSYSASYTYSYKGGGGCGLNDFKSKPTRGSSSSSNKGSDRWSFSDLDFQQKQRVADYKAYFVESKVKGSIRRSFRWLKDRYFLIVYDGSLDGARSPFDKLTCPEHVADNYAIKRCLLTRRMAMI